MFAFDPLQTLAPYVLQFGFIRSTGSLVCEGSKSWVSSKGFEIRVDHYPATPLGPPVLDPTLKQFQRLLRLPNLSQAARSVVACSIVFRIDRERSRKPFSRLFCLSQ